MGIPIFIYVIHLEEKTAVSTNRFPYVPKGLSQDCSLSFLGKVLTMAIVVPFPKNGKVRSFTKSSFTTHVYYKTSLLFGVVFIFKRITIYLKRNSANNYLQGLGDAKQFLAHGRCLP